MWGSAARLWSVIPSGNATLSLTITQHSCDRYPGYVYLWFGDNARNGKARHELELKPNAEAEWVFVPIKAGTYFLHCTIPGHTEAGMTGTITITAIFLTKVADLLDGEFGWNLLS